MRSLRATNGRLVSEPSNEIAVQTVVDSPGTPSNARCTVSGRTLTMTWGLGTTGGPPSGYRLEAGTVVGASDLARFDTGSASLSYTAVGVPPRWYNIRVRATNAAGASPPSVDSQCTVR